MLKKVILICSVLLMSLMPIHANEKNNHNVSEYDSKDNWNELYVFFIEYGVDETTAENLVNKTKNGLLLDSLNEEYANIKPQVYSMNDDETVYKTTYPDGSIKSDSIMKGSILTPYDFGGGSQSGGTTWWSVQGALVSSSTGVVTAKFLVDYCGGKGANTQIDTVYNPTVLIIGGSFSGINLSITKKTTTGGTPATASMRFSYTTLVYTKTAYLKVYING